MSFPVKQTVSMFTWFAFTPKCSSNKSFTFNIGSATEYFRLTGYSSIREPVVLILLNDSVLMNLC